MDVQHILKDALTEYDKTSDVISYLLKNKYKGYAPNNNLDRTTIEFIDENDKTILKTEIEILGIYYSKFKIWSWAWAQPGLINSQNYLSKQILLHSLNFEPNLSYIKTILTTSRGIINDPYAIDINIAIASSIIKQPYIYPAISNIGKYQLIYYLILLNKKDLDQLKIKEKRIDDIT